MRGYFKISYLPRKKIWEKNQNYGIPIVILKNTLKNLVYIPEIG
jgi:hypothetical protein